MRDRRARKVVRYLYFLGWRKAGEKDIEKWSSCNRVRLLMRWRDMQRIELRREWSLVGIKEGRLVVVIRLD